MYNRWSNKDFVIFLKKSFKSVFSLTNTVFLRNPLEAPSFRTHNLSSHDLSLFLFFCLRISFSCLVGVPANILFSTIFASQHFFAEEAHCSFFGVDLTLYPFCLQKMNWMKRGWRQDACYESYGVNGSLCSFRVYLSEVEKYCPPLETLQMPQNVVQSKVAQASFHKCFHSLSYSCVLLDFKVVCLQVQHNVSKLFELMYDNEINYKFIKDRIGRLWPKWLNAYQELEKNLSTVRKRNQLNVRV